MRQKRGGTVSGDHWCRRSCSCQCCHLPWRRRKTERPHLALQCHAETSDNIIVHSNANSPVRAAASKSGSLRIPLAVLDHLPDLHGAEFKV
jgi:hypothetical protein